MAPPRFCALYFVVVCLHFCFGASVSSYATMCDKKKRMQDCSSYLNCETCNACDGYCSWCEVGGLCTRFCEVMTPCFAADCPRFSEYRCMLMAESPGGTDGKSKIDYKKEGGIESSLYQNGMKAGMLRGGDNAPNSPQKVRPFNPLSKYTP